MHSRLMIAVLIPVAAVTTSLASGRAHPPVAASARGKTLSARPAAPTAAAGPVAVHISNFTFGPKMVTVKVGQTVTWTNDDDIPHTVVATDKSFRSKVLDTGQSFSFTFTKPGQVAYFCSLHPMMTGKVTVAAR
ncbi:cupredoxin domain-containing protein [Sphingomonas mali]|uniref:cupredoxin domain-containing protein n=1 Tax=Sphingomonas mali TaxID=40682 RepID=UPI000A905037|nr:cupredoxin family copper-binding protein [Sphingomonas mali]